MTAHAPFGNVNPHAPFEAGAGGSPSGPAGGILEGNYPNPSGIAQNAVVGAWTAVTSFGAKIEESAGTQTVRVRTEEVVGTARLRGAVKPRAGETLTAGEAILTVPVGFRPPTAEVVFSGTANKVSGVTYNLSAAGVLTCTITLGAGNIIPLDGMTWNVD